MRVFLRVRPTASPASPPSQSARKCWPLRLPNTTCFAAGRRLMGKWNDKCCSARLRCEVFRGWNGRHAGRMDGLCSDGGSGSSGGGRDAGREPANGHGGPPPFRGAFPRRAHIAKRTSHTLQDELEPHIRCMRTKNLTYAKCELGTSHTL